MRALLLVFAICCASFEVPSSTYFNVTLTDINYFPSYVGYFGSDSLPDWASYALDLKSDEISNISTVTSFTLDDTYILTDTFKSNNSTNIIFLIFLELYKKLLKYIFFILYYILFLYVCYV